MATVSMKYFNDHEASSPFDNQAQLAVALSKIGKSIIIESDDISPLTVRLFNIKNSLDRIEKCITQLIPLSFPNIFIKEGYYTGAPKSPELYGTVATSGSLEYVQSYVTGLNDWTQDPYEIPRINNYRFESVNLIQVRLVNDDTKTHTFHLHSGVFDFFANLDSSLDRVRLELNSIYVDGIKEIDPFKSKGNRDWGYYLKPNNSIVKSMTSKGYASIASILTGTLSVSLDDRTSKYRNRLIHDGDLEMLIDKASGKVLIPDNPLVSPPIFKVELLPYLKSVFSDLQELLKQVYSQVIQDVKVKGILPLL